MKSWQKKIFFLILVLLLAGIAGVWYVFNEKFTDIAETKALYTVNASDLINEFQKDGALANKKYAEKVITVKGTVSEVEKADTIVNIKFSDSATRGFIIFAFQQKNVVDARRLKEGDNISIKGSCSGGAYSEILETYFITFKRCALTK